MKQKDKISKDTKKETQQILKLNLVVRKCKGTAEFVVEVKCALLSFL